MRKRSPEAPRETRKVKPTMSSRPEKARMNQFFHLGGSPSRHRRKDLLGDLLGVAAAEGASSLASSASSISSKAESVSSSSPGAASKCGRPRLTSSSSDSSRSRGEEEADGEGATSSRGSWG